MKTEKEIKAEIKKIKSDDRFPKKKKDIATIAVNAPLALIQLGMEERVLALEWVLDRRNPS